MGVQIIRNFFETRAEVMHDLAKTGFWPTTFVSPPAPTLPIHWHDLDIEGYLIEGQAWVVDGESGERLDVYAGDKLVIPRGTLHAEGENAHSATYIVSLEKPWMLPQALELIPPDDPRRQG